MARADKGQTGAKEGIARVVDGVRSAPTNDVSPRSRVGLETVAELDARQDAKTAAASKRRDARADAGDRSAHGGRATNVAARRSDAGGQRTARGTVDTSADASADRRSSGARGIVGAVKDFFFRKRRSAGGKAATKPTARGATASAGSGATARKSSRGAKGEGASDARARGEGARGAADVRDAASRALAPRHDRAAPATKSMLGLGTTTRPVRAGEGRVGARQRVRHKGDESPGTRSSIAGTQTDRAKQSAPTRAAAATGAGSGGARAKGTGRTRPSDDAANAATGTAGSRKPVKKTAKRKTSATTSSGRKSTARKSTRAAGATSRATGKGGVRRGPTKSTAARKAGTGRTSVKRAGAKRAGAKRAGAKRAGAKRAGAKRAGA